VYLNEIIFNLKKAQVTIASDKKTFPKKIDNFLESNAWTYWNNVVFISTVIESIFLLIKGNGLTHQDPKKLNQKIFKN
jgi:hypothetical protein